MPTFTRKSIARGVKLALQHVYTPINAIKTALNAAAIDAGNIANNRVPWVSHYSMAQLDSRFFSNCVENPHEPTPELCFPLILLPPQEQWRTDRVPHQDDVQFTLDSVTLSFEQRGETAGIADAFTLRSVSSQPGDCVQALATAYTINLRIAGKQPDSVVVTPFKLASDTLFSAQYVPDAALVQNGGFNPFTWDAINQQLSGYSVYWVCLSAPNLANDSRTLLAALNSLNITVRGSSTLMQRDTGDGIQNMPPQLGAPTLDTLSIGTPVSGDTMNATGGYGANDAIGVLDRRLSDRLWSGYGKDSALPVVEHFTQDAGYEIIAVPMWQNFSKANRVTAKYAANLPFTDGLDNQATVDRRIIRLEYPIVVHHVLGVVNFSSPPAFAPYPADFRQALPGYRPGAATLHMNVGVAIGTGIRADLVAWQQVAWLNAQIGDTLASGYYDLFKQAYRGVLSQPPLGQTGVYDFDFATYPIPLVGTGGAGPVTQGKPFFAGLAGTPMQDRTDAGQIHSGATTPKTQGCEQFLEVRWAIRDNSPGDGLLSVANGGSASDDDDVYAGVGGHWVLILGKKMLAGTPAQLEV